MSKTMSKNTNPDIEALKQLRLPELRVRFTEVTGETSKSPNKTFLARRIVEALEAQAAKPKPAKDKRKSKAKQPAKGATKAAQRADTPRKKKAADQQPQTTSNAASATSGDDTPLTKLTVEELRQRYVEVIQRPTSSSSKSYLVWKLREAAKGRIPIGPRKRVTREPGSVKVLPLRMDAELVTQLDEARERLGLQSRMDLLRRAIHAFLDEHGEAEVAALFAPTPEA